MRELGVAATTDLVGRSLKAQLKYAAKTARHVIVIGEDEAAAGRAKLRDMQGGAETEIDLNDLAGLASWIQSKGAQ